MHISVENLNRQRSKFHYSEDQIDSLFPLRLEEEEEEDFDEIENFKKKQKQLKDELLKKKKSESEKDNKDLSH